jgi:hypothetical protein
VELTRLQAQVHKALLARANFLHIVHQVRSSHSFALQSRCIPVLAGVPRRALHPARHAPTPRSRVADALT